MVTTELLPPATVMVSSVATGELETDAMVVGNFACPTQGVKGEVATPILALRVLLMFPPVGMEALVVADVVRGFSRFGAGTATYHSQTGSATAPTAGRL